MSLSRGLQDFMDEVAVELAAVEANVRDAVNDQRVAGARIKALEMKRVDLEAVHQHALVLKQAVDSRTGEVIVEDPVTIDRLGEAIKAADARVLR